MANFRDIVKAPASFNGVPFFVDRSRRSGGRRKVSHQIPFSEDPNFVEDEGLESPTFDVEGFVVGDEYISKRDALLTELERKGPGTLVHPFYGTQTVQVGPVTVEESKDELGCARFTISFEKTLPLPVNPTSAASGPAAVLASAAGARSAALAAFNKANAVVSAVTAPVQGALTALSSTLNTLSATVSLPSQAAASLTSQIVALKNNALGLASAPADLAASVLGVVDTLVGAFDPAQSGSPFAFFLTLFNRFDPGPRPAGTTPQNVIAQTNFDATVLLIQRAAVIAAAEEAVAQPFDNADAAIAARDQLLGAIDALNDSASDDTFPFFSQLASDLVKALPGDGLPRLLAYTPPGTVPSLVLAAKIYTAHPSTFETFEAAETDIVVRNRVPHPGFVRGGQPLTVLSNG
jgi:prophage DNA circulation protein